MKHIIFFLIFSSYIFADNLKIVTFNMWSGLDYRGIFKMGYYESSEHRELRFNSMLKQLKDLDADVIFLQEANPAPVIASRLADSLDYDYILNVSNSGIKISSIGLPSNLREGNVILARKSLKLKFFDNWKLSGSVGAHGDLFSFHLTDAIFALVGKIIVNNTPVFLVTTHLTSGPPMELTTNDFIISLVTSKRITKEQLDKAVYNVDYFCTKRIDEIEELIDRCEIYSKRSPLIIAGDMNCSLHSKEFKSTIENQYLATENINEQNITWNPINPNIIIQNSENIPLRAEDNELNDAFSILDSLGDNTAQDLDHIFLNNKFLKNDIIKTSIVLDQAVDGVTASDHYGIYSEINLSNASVQSEKEYDYFIRTDRYRWEAFPLAAYDTDVGFGIGATSTLRDAFGGNELLSIILFGSTKGERWIRFEFNYPDKDLRQGKIYPLAFDFTADYDVYLKNSFFGLGAESKFFDREYYKREPLILHASVSRGFTPEIVSDLGIKAAYINNMNFSDSSRLKFLKPDLNNGLVKYYSLNAHLRYDSRDIVTNPSRGFLAAIEAEWAPNTSLGNVSFARIGAQLQYIQTLFYPKTVLATRFYHQSLFGDKLPVQTMLPIGGTRTLRGFPQDRFLDNTSTVANLELRFPIFWVFGGVIGADLGGVNNRHSITPDKLLWNSVVGLRIDIGITILRADFGFSKEFTGMYLNIGQMF